MTTPHKLHGLLGMSKRAGKLTLGFDAAVAAVKSGESTLIAVAQDCSPKTEKECRFCASQHHAEVVRLPFDRSALAAAVGFQKPVAVAAVCDDGFAKAIRTYCIVNKEEDSL